MALGALTLPSVGTSFATSESKALVPYSPPSIGVAQKMSPMESLTEVFYEIRDSINNLGVIFSERMSNLNDHLAFRLTEMNFHLKNLAYMGLMAKDRDEEKLKIAGDREREIDRGESLDDAEGDDGEGGGKKLGWLDTLKDAFGRTKEGFSNIGTKMKLLLLATGLFALMKYTDEIQPKINKLAILYSKLNSSVKPFIPNKKTPTQKPVHIGQRISVPNQLDFSIINSR